MSASQHDQAISPFFHFCVHLWSSVTLASFLECQKGPFLCFDKVVLENQPTLLGSIVIYGSIPWVLPSRSLNKARFAFLKARIANFLSYLAHLTQDFKLHNVVVIAAKVPLSFHNPNCFLIVCGNRSNRAPT